MKKYFLKQLGADEQALLTKRPNIRFDEVMEIVRPIMADVKENGDAALRKYTARFDGVELENLFVSEEEIAGAVGQIAPEIRSAFEVAKSNIESFHKAQVLADIEVETMPGMVCSRQTRPIEKVGLYIPGGSAPLPSTVLMMGIPAQIAACEEVVLCTPPDREGKIPDILLYAANLVGITKVYKLGGAQAIAAMAYGSESVNKVYKIFGPGNQYVTAAKMLASIEADGPAIDLPAGPSEALVIADVEARAEFVAADLLSQAEHGEDSQVVLLCTDTAKCDEILNEVASQLEKLPRKEIASVALGKSFAIVTENIEQALEFSNAYAPEHLILNIVDAEKYCGNVKNAGSVFLGQYTPEAVGDYASGTNHTLPTYGYAKAYSGLSLNSFTKQITFQKLDKTGIAAIGKTVEKMADCEGLFAHKNAVSVRLNSLT